MQELLQSWNYAFWLHGKDARLANAIQQPRCFAADVFYGWRIYVGRCRQCVDAFEHDAVAVQCTAALHNIAL